jgi:hypothetical protein
MYEWHVRCIPPGMRALLLAVVFAGSALVACKGVSARNDSSGAAPAQTTAPAPPVADAPPAPPAPPAAAPVVETAPPAVVTPATRVQRTAAQGTRAGIGSSLAARKPLRSAPAPAQQPEPVAAAPANVALVAAPAAPAKPVKAKPTMAHEDPWAGGPAPAPAAAPAKAAADMHPYD